jgi:hypothetical protein
MSSLKKDLALRRAKSLFDSIPPLIDNEQVNKAFELYSLYGKVISEAPGVVEILYMRGSSTVKFIDYLSQKGMMSKAEEIFSNLDEMSSILVPDDVILKGQCAFGIGLIIMGYFLVAKNFQKTGEWYREFLDVVAEIPKKESNEDLDAMISSIINTLPSALTMNAGLPHYA